MPFWVYPFESKLFFSLQMICDVPGHLISLQALTFYHIPHFKPFFLFSAFIYLPELITIQ